MSNLTVENVYIRHNAKLLTNKHFWKLLGMTLIIAAIVFGLVAVGMALLMLNGESTDISIAMVCYLLLMLIVTLLTSGLTLGYIQALLALCRGEEVSVSQVFSRMGQCFKAFRLSLWVGLKIMLWALPLYAIIGFVGFGIAVAGDPNAAELTNATAQITLMVLPLVALVGVATLVIPAALRYMLSTYVLADKPDTGVRACVHESKAMMKGHKWQAFKLVIPMILMVYLIMIAIMIVLVIGSTVFAETSPVALAVLGVVLGLVMMVTGLIYAMRMTLAYCLFYLKRKGEVSPTPVEEEERIVCWMPNSDAQ